jgi:hypothetical protein
VKTEIKKYKRLNRRYAITGGRRRMKINIKTEEEIQLLGVSVEVLLTSSWSKCGG